MSERCICDGAAYGFQAHPFLIHPGCPFHGAAASLDTAGHLRWELGMESAEAGVRRGQFAQSWDGFEGEMLRLRVQMYANGRIVVYPFRRDETTTETVWELPA